MLRALYPDRPDAAPSFAAAEEPGSFGQMAVEAGNALANPALAVLRTGAQLATPEGLDLTAGAYRYSRLSRLVSSRDASLEEAADQRIDALRQATGVELENPYRGGYFIEARKRVRERMYDQDYDWHLGIPGAARQVFDERVADLAAQHSDKVSWIDLRPLEEHAKALASGAEDAMPGLRERATDAGIGPTARFIAELTGGIGAGFRDPVTQMSVVVGPVGAVGKTVLMRALSDGGVQGLFNVGLAIYEHPSVAAWREERGRDGGGPLPTMAETATAFLAGAIPGAGLRVLFEALPKLRVNIPEEAIRAGERSAAAEERMLAERPAGVTPDDHVAALTQAQRHDADPAHEPPPPASSPTFAGESLPTAGVAPANIAADGTVYVGKSNSLHYMLNEKFAQKIRDDLGLQPGEATWRSEGFVTPEGRYLDRKQAFDWVAKNEKPVRSSDNMASNELDAIDYYEQVPETVRARVEAGDAVRRDVAKIESLSPQAREMVDDGRATPEAGLIAAEQARNPEDHLPILERLASEHPVDAKEARVIAADEVAAQASKRETHSLEESFAQGAEKIPLQEMPPAIAAAGERPSLLADLVRSCQD